MPVWFSWDWKYHSDPKASRFLIDDVRDHTGNILRRTYILGLEKHTENDFQPRCTVSLRNMRLEVKRCQTDMATHRKTHLWIAYVTSEKGQYSCESPWLSPAEGKRCSEVAPSRRLICNDSHANHRAWRALEGSISFGLAHSGSVLYDRDHTLQHLMCTSVIKLMWPQGGCVF